MREDSEYKLTLFSVQFGGSRSLSVVDILASLCLTALERTKGFGVDCAEVAEDWVDGIGGGVDGVGDGGDGLNGVGGGLNEVDEVDDGNSCEWQNGLKQKSLDLQWGW